MDISARRRPWAFVIYGCLFVCLTPALSSSISARPRTSCAALQAWAAQYKNQAPTLDAFAAFDRPRRIAVFNAVSPAVRAALMREHLDRWVREPGLTDDQRSLLAEAKNLLTPTLYSRRDGPEHQALRQFWSRAAPAFPSTDNKLPWFDVALPTKRISSTGLATANAGEPPCECNFGHPWPNCFRCTAGGCEAFTEGCGPWGAYECNGVCE